MFRNFFPKAMMFLLFIMLLGSLPSILFGGHQKTGKPQAKEKTREANSILIGFFNGIGNTPEDAKFSKNALAIKFGSTSPSGKPIVYDVFYNHSYGFIPDLLEVFSQRMSEQSAFNGQYELFWSAIAGSTKPGFDTGFALAITSFSELVSKQEASYMSRLDISTRMTGDLQEHHALLRKYIHSKSRIIFIAHSQGNLFANSAYDFLALQKRTANIIHVATASSVTHGHYITADKDRVIDLLRTAQPGAGVPWGNVEIPAWVDRPCGVNGECDWKGHGFLAVYLNEHLKPVGEIEKAVREAIDAQ